MARGRDSRAMNLAGGLAESYILDAAQSRFLVRGTATGLLSSFGHNPTIAIRSFTGEARFLSQAPETSSLWLKIDAASLAVTGQVSEKDRREMEEAMHRDVLQSGHYPQILFESTGAEGVSLAAGLYRIRLFGRLALHGITRELEIPANVTFGAESLRANGEFSIRQTDYGIRPASALGGAIKLKDELKFSFDIAGYRR